MQTTNRHQNRQRYHHLGKEEINLNEEVQLKSGLATFFGLLRTETFMIYDWNKRKYLEKKASVTVYVVSPRGKNVAGVFPLDLSVIMNKSIQEHSFTNQLLQRCPDKQATISTKIKGTVLQQLVDANISLASDRSGAFIQPNNRVLSITSQKLRFDSRFPTPRLQNNLSQKKIDRNFSQSKNKRSIVQEVSTPLHNTLMGDNRSDYNSKYFSKQDSVKANDNFKLKNRINELQRQVQSLRKQQVQKKKLQNQVDSLSYKITELQKVVNSSKLQSDFSSKQRKRGDIENSNRIQQLQKLNLTLQKRVDIKSTFYKEELQKYNSKLLSLQNQKQQLVLNNSQLRDENFDLNRKINSLKDKQKILNDDKLKLTKRIQQFKKQPLQKNVHFQTTGKDMAYQRLKQTISNSELQKLSLTDQLQKLKNQVMNEGIFRIKYEQELKQKNNLIQQKLYIESQYQINVEEIRNQNNRVTRQLSEKIDQIHDLNTKILQLTNKNKLEGERFMQQVQTLKQTLQFVRGTQQKGRSQYQELSYVAQQNHKQLLDANKQCASLDSNLRQYQYQNDQLKKSLQQTTQQSHQLILQNQKLNSIISDFENQLTFEGQSRRDHEQQHKLVNQKLESTNKQLQQQLSLIQQQLFTTKSHFEQQQIIFTEQVQRKDRMIKQKQVELRNIYESQTQLQMKNAQFESNQIQLYESIRNLESELKKQRIVIQNLKKNTLSIQDSQSTLKQLLSETKNSLQQKELQYEQLSEQNKSLNNLLSNTQNEYEVYKDNINNHIHLLLKSLVTRNNSQQPTNVQGLAQGLIKLENDVITKVKNCYEQLQIVSQKLLTKQMQQITTNQNNDLQIQTLQIQLGQVKKQLQISKNQNSTLNSNIEQNKGSFIEQNQNLKNKMKQLEQQLHLQFSIKSKEVNGNFEKQIEILKQQNSKEKEGYLSTIKNLQNQLTDIQKQLYDQYNQANIMSLREEQNIETIKSLENRIIEITQKEGVFEDDRTKYISDIMFLEQEIQKINQSYQSVKKNLQLALEREAILVEQNQYMRLEFQSKSTLSTNSHFEQRQKNVIEIHRANSQKDQLNEIVQQLQNKLNQKDIHIKLLEQNLKSLENQVQQKYKTIYQLQNQIKQSKGKLRDLSRSRANISKTSSRAQPTKEDKIQISNKLKQIQNSINYLIINPSQQTIQDLRKMESNIEDLLKLDTFKDQTIRSNSLLP